MRRISSISDSDRDTTRSLRWMARDRFRERPRESRNARRAAIMAHRPRQGQGRATGSEIGYACAMNDRLHAPDLNPGFAWLNTDRPLTFARELKGQVVLLDFWTYCCINCMHILPDLAYLERKYKDEPFLVVGVHSAKFTNEGHRQTVRAAINRYEIAHPVVID